MPDNQFYLNALGESISKEYKEFFSKFDQLSNLQTKDWKTVHVIGYFCKKYKEYYNFDYTFKFNTPQPSKCYEVFQINKVATMLSSNPEILKDYIDWVFTTQVSQRKRKITVIGYLANINMINDFKFKVLFNKPNVDRSTYLPNNILNIVSEFGVNTYGDLSFFVASNPSEEIILRLDNEKFDFSILEKLK